MSKTLEVKDLTIGQWINICDSSLSCEKCPLFDFCSYNGICVANIDWPSLWSTVFKIKVD